MTIEKSAEVAAIDNARALIDGMLASDWKELHIASDGLEIFIARNGAGPNPMLGGYAVAEPAASAPAEAPVASRDITAPHVATLVSIVAVGTQVEAGAPLAVLSVLDEQENLAAPCAGRVVAHLAGTGDLVEFGTPLVRFEELG